MPLRFINSYVSFRKWFLTVCESAHQTKVYYNIRGKIINYNRDSIGFVRISEILASSIAGMVIITKLQMRISGEKRGR